MKRAREASIIQKDFVEAVRHHQAGRLAEAVYRRVLGVAPDNTDANHLLGVISYQNGKFEEAAGLIGKALAGNPAFPEAHNNLGLVLNALERLDEAQSSFARALELKPDCAEAHNNLGLVLMEAGRREEAQASFTRALEIAPNSAEAHYNLGNLFLDAGKLKEAERSFVRALEHKPDYAEVYNNLGNVLKDTGQAEEAAASYGRALEINPDYAEAHYNLGNLLKETGRLEEAQASYARALEIKPDLAGALNNLGNLLRDNGYLDAAADTFKRLLALDGDELRFRIRKALMLPPIAPSQDHMASRRETMAGAMAAITEEGGTLDDPAHSIGATNFYLAYHGLNDRDLQRAIAGMYLRVCPSLAEETGREQLQGRDSRKIRVGFLSRFFCRHTIGKLTLGLVEELDREKFEVILIRAPGKRDDMAAAFDKAADHVVELTRNLESAREAVTAQGLDILFYPEIGMDPFTYFLAFARLAPVQCLTWGHPVTTGIPNMDYFLSSEALDLAQAQDHYSERLVRHRHLPTFYHPPSAPEEIPSRADLGLPETGRLYVSPQSLFKFHPDFDSVLGDILRKDPEGVLVLISGPTDYWEELLRARFTAAFPDQAGRVIFLPRMSEQKFMALNMRADALLDPPYFGGGNTALEAFSAGLPIVTWPGEFMRGRVTGAMYHAMGVEGLVADSSQSYVDLAHRLATDGSFREAMKTGISRNSSLLFENHAAVRELEEFFVQAVAAAREGRDL